MSYCRAGSGSCARGSEGFEGGGRWTVRGKEVVVIAYLANVTYSKLKNLSQVSY
jgi:hypothetical protein